DERVRIRGAAGRYRLRRCITGRGLLRGGSRGRGRRPLRSDRTRPSRRAAGGRGSAGGTRRAGGCLSSPLRTVLPGRGPGGLGGGLLAPGCGEAEERGDADETATIPLLLLRAAGVVRRCRVLHLLRNV